MKYLLIAVLLLAFAAFGKLIGSGVGPAEDERRAKWQPKAPKYTKGLLKLYSQHAVSPMKGAYME